MKYTIFKSSKTGDWRPNTLTIAIVCLIGIYTNINSAVVPYYSFQLSEGVYVPNRGKWGYTTVLTNDIGVIVKPGSSHSILSLYQLRYIGPGLKRQEAESFEQRNMSHNFMFQHTWKIFPDITFKTKLNYSKEFWRTGANEIWGLGLYDLNRIGGGIEVNLDRFKIKSYAGLKYNFFEFPNYTDLLQEYKTGSEETSTGKQNNHMYQISAGLNYDKNTVSLDIIMQNYIKQYIVESSGQYSTSIKQQDKSIVFYVARKQPLIENVLNITPSFILKIKDSNQSYLHFKVFGSTTSEFVPDYYDYNKLTFSFPLTFSFSPTKSFTFAPELEQTYYIQRPPRDSDNNLKSGEKQYNTLTILYFGYNYIPDETSRMTLFYIIQTQTSNMKFEKYFPYNYSGQYFGIKFSYSY